VIFDLRRKKEEGRRKKEEGRREKEEGRRKKEERLTAMVSAIKNAMHSKPLEFSSPNSMGLKPLPLGRL
jgi:hypothetical protein